MKRKLYWGIATLLILLFGIAVVFLYTYTNTEPKPKKVYNVPTDIQQVKKAALKPPPGETYATGYWHKDHWHRTAPPEPEHISVNSEMLSYEELKKKLNQSGVEPIHTAYVS